MADGNTLEKARAWYERVYRDEWCPWNDLTDRIRAQMIELYLSAHTAGFEECRAAAAETIASNQRIAADAKAKNEPLDAAVCLRLTESAIRALKAKEE